MSDFHQGTEGSVEPLLRIMARLRDEKTGCPWDKAQNFSTIAPYTIEEAYEVADAIDRDDMPALKDELGDLLFQVVFHAQMAEEAGVFTFADVVDAICDKMTRRHPHVFDMIEAGSAEEQTRRWETIKRTERAASGEHDDSTLAGISRGLPEWQRAVKLQARAARAGFDWPGPKPVIAKLKEEIDEVSAEFSQRDGDLGQQRLQEEIGDVLFVCANLARHARVDVGAAMRQANLKFERRFRAMEQMARADGNLLAELPLERQETYWQRVKALEKGDSPA
ncbi:MAG: nucleoside triphosphate pyrophosphohydrolase [Xanthomonadaceae bacterium]|nr:nucleoside triphosphate pyrophosphohydrolase [Xanthomonadaceae bacterium]